MMDERHGGQYHFVRDDEVVVHQSVLDPVPTYPLIRTGITALLVVFFTMLVLAAKGFVYHDIAADRSKLETIMAFHDHTSEVVVAIAALDNIGQSTHTQYILGRQLNEIGGIRLTHPELAPLLIVYQQSIVAVMEYTFNPQAYMHADLVFDYVQSRERLLRGLTESVH